MAKLALSVAFLFGVCSLYAQQNHADSSRPAIRAKQLYDAHRGVESAIFNGVQFYPYPRDIEGMPFFQPDWQSGTVVYDNVVYENILMKYELVNDQLVVSPYKDGGLFISLFSPRVNEFSFAGLKFIRLGTTSDGASIPEGFYRQLAQGRITALARSTKVIAERIESTQLFRKFEEKTRYYILKNGKYYSVNNKNDLLSVLGEHKKKIQEFLQENNLNYRKNPEKSIIAAVEIYNQSN